MRDLIYKDNKSNKTIIYLSTMLKILNDYVEELNKLKMVIVDFDNTLFDTNQAHYLSYKNVLKKYGAEFNLKMYQKFSGLNKNDFYLRVIGKKL